MEMIGVLMIMAVLSIVGLWGYQTAIQMWREAETYDQVAKTIVSARTGMLFNRYKDFLGKSAATGLYHAYIIDIREIIDDVNFNNGDAGDRKNVQSFDTPTNVPVWVRMERPDAFTVRVSGLNPRMCENLLKMDTGYDYAYVRDAGIELLTEDLLTDYPRNDLLTDETARISLCDAFVSDAYPDTKPQAQWEADKNYDTATKANRYPTLVLWFSDTGSSNGDTDSVPIFCDIINDCPDPECQICDDRDGDGVKTCRWGDEGEVSNKCLPNMIVPPPVLGCVRGTILDTASNHQTQHCCESAGIPKGGDTSKFKWHHFSDVNTCCEINTPNRVTDHIGKEFDANCCTQIQGATVGNDNQTCCLNGRVVPSGIPAKNDGTPAVGHVTAMCCEAIGGVFEETYNVCCAVNVSNEITARAQAGITAGDDYQTAGGTLNGGCCAAAGGFFYTYRSGAASTSECCQTVSGLPTPYVLDSDDNPNGALSAGCCEAAGGEYNAQTGACCSGNYPWVKAFGRFSTTVDETVCPTTEPTPPIIDCSNCQPPATPPDKPVNPPDKPVVTPPCSGPGCGGNNGWWWYTYPQSGCLKSVDCSVSGNTITCEEEWRVGTPDCCSQAGGTWYQLTAVCCDGDYGNLNHQTATRTGSISSNATGSTVTWSTATVAVGTQKWGEFDARCCNGEDPNNRPNTKDQICCREGSNFTQAGCCDYFYTNGEVVNGKCCSGLVDHSYVNPEKVPECCDHSKVDSSTDGYQKYCCQKLGGDKYGPNSVDGGIDDECCKSLGDYYVTEGACCKNDNSSWGINESGEKEKMSACCAARQGEFVGSGENAKCCQGAVNLDTNATDADCCKNAGGTLSTSGGTPICCNGSKEIKPGLALVTIEEPSEQCCEIACAGKSNCGWLDSAPCSGVSGGAPGGGGCFECTEGGGAGYGCEVSPEDVDEIKADLN